MIRKVFLSFPGTMCHLFESCVSFVNETKACHSMSHMWDVLMAGWISLRFFIPQAGAKQTDKQADDPSDPKMEILPSGSTLKPPDPKLMDI